MRRQAWIDLDPTNASAHQRMGIVLFQLDKPTEAVEQFRTAKKLDPKAVQPKLAMARLSDDAKKRDTARQLIEAAIKAAPGDPSVPLAAAQWYLGQNDLSRAKTLADDALTNDGASYVAKLLSDRGEKDRAPKILEEVLAKEPMFATRPDAVDLLAKLRNGAG